MSHWPPGDSEMARLIRQHHWAATPLGPIGGWPERLKGAVDLVLGSGHAMQLAWGPERTVLYNDAYAPMLGRRHPSSLGLPFRDAWPDVWTEIEPLVERVFAGETIRFEDLPLTMTRHGTPEETWWNFSYSPVRDEAGAVAGLLNVTVDATGKVRGARAELALRQSEERLRLAVEATGLGIFDWDLTTDRVTVNSRFKEIVGLRTGDEVIGAAMMAHVVHPEDQAFVEARIAEACAPGASGHYEFEHRAVTPAGERWLLTCGQVGFAGEGADRKPVRIVGNDLDITERRRAEAERRESEARFQQLAGAVNQVFHVADPVVGRLLYVSPAYERIWGRPAEPILEDLGRFPDAIHPEDRDRVRAAQGRPLAEQGGEVEYRILRPDGEVRWIRDRVFPVLGDGSAPGRLVGVAEDITESHKVWVELQELAATLEQRVAERTAEREALARLVETTGSAVQALDRDYRWTALNEAAIRSYERLYGVRPAVGQSLRELLADRPDDWAAAKAAWDRALRGESYSETAEWGAAERERRVYEMRFEVLRDTVGGVTGAFLTGLDVTERVRAQAALAEAEAARRATDALYRAFFESSPEALFVIGVEPDGGFVVEEINPAHEASVGWKAEEIRSRRIDEFLPPALAEQVQGHYRRAVETGEIEQWRETYQLQGDAQHWDSSLVPLRGPDGRVVRLLGSSRNVTRQVTTEEALRQSQKMEAMGQLTGGVAHDFNNLLTPIMAVLDRLRRQGLGGEREQRLIEGAAQSAERARTLVQRLLAFARRQPLQPTAVNVGALLQGIADLVASTTGPQIRVAVEVAPELPPARSDANQLEMAILNLAVNARDAMPDGGTLRLSALAEEVPGPDAARLKLPPGRYVRLSVADTGVGMDEATLARAVEPFFSTKGVGKGTGLGLSMVHGFVSQLGGAIEIRSRPGLGTHVELWLPESREAAEATPVTSAPEPLERRGTALLVDDEEAVRLSTADMLGELGYGVMEAASAEEALHLVQEGTPFDLLVTDHLMPGINGSDLARRLKTLRPSVPVLIISGYAESEGIEPDLPRLSKPFRKDELEATLAELVNAGAA